MTINWAGQTFELCADKALFWRERKTLIFSDVHLGKAHDFQAAGIPVPASVHDDDLGRIAALVQAHAPKRVLILGDFVHSHGTNLDDLISAFRLTREGSGAQWILALGNHDYRAKDKLLAWGFDAILAELEEEGILFSHDPSKDAPFAISGHVHPVIKLGAGRDRMRLPCFVVNDRRIILPSFGSFTGGFEIKPRKQDRIYVAAHDKIVDL